MGKFDSINPRTANTQEENPVEDVLKVESEHAEAVAFVEKHRDFFEHYAKGKIKVEPAPKGLKTFAFNLETNTIYVNSMFYKKRGLSDERTLFAILHEIEHFLEKRDMFSEEGGEKKFGKYLKRIKESKAFSLHDNCVADIRENRTVVQRTNTGMGELETKIYKEDLFANIDFSRKPRHIQFSEALLREARVPGEKCTVSPEVRDALDEVAKVEGLMDVMTDPGTSMSMRLRLQEKYIWPKVAKLLEKDIEDKKKKKEEAKKEKDKEEGEDKEEDGEPEEGNEDEGEGDKGEDGGEEGDEKDGEDGDGDEGESGGDDGDEEKSKGKGKKGKSENKPGKEGGDEGGENSDGTEEDDGLDEEDPNKIFAKDYADAEKNFPEAIPIEEIEKAFEEWKKKRGENVADRADGDYAKKIGVEKGDLQKYRKIVKELEKIVNPETNVGVIDELKRLFSRIISKRLKKAQAPRYPVDEGDELVDPAQLVADVKSGNFQPKVWEDTEIKEKRGDQFGEVEITLVCDRSYTMTEGQKAIEQQKSAVLIMEVLKSFAELCNEEKMNVSQPLEIRSEIYGFGAGEDKTPMKKMSAELGEAERVNVLKKLGHLPGSTTDFNCLEAIAEGVTKEIKNKIRDGMLKKIVIVLTDGGSDDSIRVQGVLKGLQEDGVIVIGLGITEKGKPVLSTYAPNAMVVEDVSKMTFVVGKLLEKHLKDI